MWKWLQVVKRFNMRFSLLDLKYSRKCPVRSEHTCFQTSSVCDVPVDRFDGHLKKKKKKLKKGGNKKKKKKKKKVIFYYIFL